MYVTWVTPLNSVLPNRGVSQAAVIVFVLAWLSAAALVGSLWGRSCLSKEFCSADGSQVRKGRAWREEQDVSFPAVFLRSSAAAWRWAPMATALLRVVEPLEFGVWPPQQPVEKTQRHRWISSPWERELVEPGCVVRVVFLLGALLAVVLISLFA